MAEGSSEDLVERIRSGDEAAARQFFRDLYPQVLRIVRNHRPRRQSEEDLCQMIFMQVFIKLHQYSGRMPVSHWVSRVAVNTCLNALKKEQRRPEVREADVSQEEWRNLERMMDASPPEAGVGQSAAELVGRLLGKLKPEDRIIMAFLYLDGYSVAETSARTGFSQPVIKIRAFRARQKLNQEMRRLTQEESQ